MRRVAASGRSRCVRLVFLLLVAACVSTPGHAWYWEATFEDHSTERCSDGCQCARDQQANFYPEAIPEGCYFEYNALGTLSTAVFLGHNAAGAIRNGFGSLRCETGEYRTAAGCVTAPPPDNASDCKTLAGNPVDTRSGRKVEETVDYTTEGPNPLEFRRYYSSNTSYLSGDFGPTRLGLGWRSNFDSSPYYNDNPAATNPPSGVYVVLPDGETFGFKWFTTGYKQQYLNWATKIFVNGTQNGRLASLARNTTTQRYELTDPDNTVWSYDYNSHLRTITYRGGYSVELSYDANGNNTLVQDSFGRQISFGYTTQGLLSTMTVPGGQVYQYAYLARYDPAIFSGPTDKIEPRWWTLQYVTFPDDDEDPDDNPKIEYHYEDTTNIYALTGITDERGVRWATFAYDSAARVISSEHAGSTESYAFSYDNTAHTTTVTNPLTKQSIYHFALDARSLPRLTQIEGVASSHCAAANTSYAYDSNNFLNQVTDGEGRVTHMVNDATRGLPTSVTRGYGTGGAVTDSYSWHATLNVPTEIVQPGLTTDLTWNSSGQLTELTETDTTTTSIPYATNGETRTWAYTYTTGGLLASVDGPLSGTGDTVSYAYNGNGFIQTVTDEVGHETDFTAWNGRGQPTSMTDPNGVVTSLAYDPLGRLKTLTADPSGIAAETSFDYDAAGEVTKITRPNGAYLEYTWNDGRQLTKVADNNGDYIGYDRDAMGNDTGRRIKTSGGTLLLTQSATFDELARLLSFAGASSQTWAFAYDKTDDRTAVTDPRSNVYHWAFDALDRLIGETDEDSHSVTLTRNGKDEITNYQDPRVLSTAYVRDGFGDIIQRASPDSGISVYYDNALGKPTKIVDARSVETDLTYDNAGRMLTKTFPAASSENIAYTWDDTTAGNKGIGRLTKIEDASGSVGWVYDALGRKTEEKKTTAAEVYTIDYAYDAAGNVTEVTYPSGRIVTYARDALGRISGVTTKHDSGSASVTLASDVTYQPFGPSTGLTFGNGLALTRSFTEDYLLSEIKLLDGTTPVLDRSYARSDGLNLTGITDNVTSARSESFGYTPSNRLNEGDSLWGTLGWTYDAVGNRTSQTLTSGTTTTDSYDYPGGSNRLSDIAEGASTVRSFTHDAAGNVIEDDRGATAYHYRYNKRGRMDELTIGATLTADYTYDGLERMAVRATASPSATTHYLYDTSGRLLAEADGATGDTLTEYVWLDDLPLALVAGVNTMTPELYFVHADHLNRPVMMTDASKAVVWDAVYYPFGEAYSITGSATNNLRFPGQYFLLESGLAYNWYRDYDPSLGRYLQPDPPLPERDVPGAETPSDVALPSARDASALESGVRGIPADVPGEIVEPTEPALPLTGASQPLPLPSEFTNGASLYAYVKSSPVMQTDPKGLRILRPPFSPIRRTGAQQCQSELWEICRLEPGGEHPSQVRAMTLCIYYCPQSRTRQPLFLLGQLGGCPSVMPHRVGD